MAPTSPAIKPFRPFDKPPTSAEPSELPVVVLGSNRPTAQHGVLGKLGHAKVAIDLEGCNTVSLFGVQGFGKSYTLGVVAEMAVTPIPGINMLPAPLATIVFHYHSSDVYEPELLAGLRPNTDRGEVKRLVSEYGVTPQGMQDVVLLVPEAKVEQRRAEYPGVQVEAIKFSSNELKASGWKFLLGAYGNDSLYLRQLSSIMRGFRDALTLQKIRDVVNDEASGLSETICKLIASRLAIAEPYIDDTKTLGDLIQPGRTIVVDLRDAWIEKQEALELFVVLMQIFAAARREEHESEEGGSSQFNRLVIFDEAHKYITEGEIIGHVVETIREMRHHATTVMIASQDPMSVPRVVLELTTVLIMHRMSSPGWLKHMRGAILALEYVPDKELATLDPGEALVWAQKSTDRRFTQAPQKMTIRPRVTAHGGGTKTATRGKKKAAP